jgi:hypothetical protein
MTRTATHKEQGNTIEATLFMSFELSEKNGSLPCLRPEYGIDNR